jgi:hypothetical protein
VVNVLVMLESDFPEWQILVDPLSPTTCKEYKSAENPNNHSNCKHNVTLNSFHSEYISPNFGVIQECITNIRSYENKWSIIFIISQVTVNEREDSGKVVD